MAKAASKHVLSQSELEGGFDDVEEACAKPQKLATT